MDDDDEISNLPEEIGSDELLSDDNLRLPESANILVRLHAVRAWLARRRNEAIIVEGEAALNLQQAMISEPQEVRPRRRERQDQEESISRAQEALRENHACCLDLIIAYRRLLHKSVVIALTPIFQAIGVKRGSDVTSFVLSLHLHDMIGLCIYT